MVSSLLVLACSAEQVEPRAQTLLYIDTNAPLVSQLVADPEIPGAIAVDTVRIDRLDAAGEPVETRELVAPELQDWPISLGVVGSSPVRFRVRAFRGSRAGAGEDGRLVPTRNLAMDRLLELSPQSSFTRQLVLLDAACFNAPASFRGNWTSCIDAASLAGSPSQGVSAVSSPPLTQAGTSPLADTTPCTGPRPQGAACIPGGTGLLGDEAAALFTSAIADSPVPAHVVRLSPFFLDRTEVTVGRYRAQLAKGRLKAPQPLRADPDLELQRACTYLGPEDSTNDALPLNCVALETASELCHAQGGELPSEAQWEYAARGRGEARLFPWGSGVPSCCTASIGREGVRVPNADCPGSDIEPVGSHTGSPDCPLGDVSRDGLLDMAGSLSEVTLDNYRPYEHKCWTARGTWLDPLCRDADATLHTLRGSYFSASFATAMLVIRSQAASGATVGFRCAYPAEATP